MNENSRGSKADTPFADIVKLLDEIAVCKATERKPKGEALEFWKFVVGCRADGTRKPDYDERIKWLLEDDDGLAIKKFPQCGRQPRVSAGPRPARPT